jgi:uncharacterized membrane protein
VSLAGPSVFFPALNEERSRRSARSAVWLFAPLAVGGLVLVTTGFYVPYLTPVAGLTCVLGVPIYIVLTTTEWRGIPLRERVVLSLSAGIVLVLIVGLVIDTVLPLVGVSRPLDRIPVVCVTSAAWLVLWLRRRHKWSPLLPNFREATVGARDCALVALALVTVVMSIAGANRINNNAGSGAAVATQVLVVLLLAATLVWRDRLAEGTAAVVVYATGLALLFQTSLRGWFVTGHDIQHEYFVFSQTLKAGHWSFANVHDSYNACLSITILPTMILHFTGLDGPYIYKVCFQLLFAFSGVIAYAIAARLMSRGLALVSAVFFIAFPTFFTDMPFLNRQEIAFLLCGCCFLLFLIDELPLHRRRAWMTMLVLATVVTHYSTSYLLLGVLAIAKLLELANRWISDRRHVRVPRSPISLLILAFACALSLAWGSGSAQSNRDLANTLGSVISALDGSAGSLRSDAASYSLLGVKSPSAGQLLHAYVDSTLPKAPAARAAAEKVAAAYPPKLAAASVLPTTALGRALDRAGIDVATLNTFVRSWSARLFQLLVIAGLIAAITARRRRAKLSIDFYFVAIGSMVMVGLLVALPVISVDYGILRAFQQALFVLAPFMTIGCVWVGGIVGRKVAAIGTAVLSLVMLTSLVGLMPQALGGYPAQLTLNNSGQYYDLYYVSPEEVAAAGWLGTHAPAGTTVSSDSTTATILSNYLSLYYASDIYPTLLLHRGSFVFLDYAEVRLGQTTVGQSGTNVTYDYPLGFLNANRNLVFAEPDVRVYH